MRALGLEYFRSCFGPKMMVKIEIYVFLILFHPFQMKSAIDPEIMPYTNYTYDFKGMIDYIFYPRQSMKPLGFLGPIDAAWLKENKVIGSPHPHLNSGN